MKLALTAQLLLLAYHQVTTLFDLYPFNGARFSRPAERAGEAIFNGLLMLWPPLVYACGWTPGLPAAAMYYLVLFACEAATWFVPYAIGGSERWTRTYARIQGRTLQLLPARGDHPTPNLEHLILIALTLLAGGCSLAVVFRLRHGTLNGWPAMLAVGALMVAGIGATHWRRPGPRLTKAS